MYNSKTTNKTYTKKIYINVFIASSIFNKYTDILLKDNKDDKDDNAADNYDISLINKIFI